MRQKRRPLLIWRQAKRLARPGVEVDALCCSSWPVLPKRAIPIVDDPDHELFAFQFCFLTGVQVILLLATVRRRKQPIFVIARRGQRTKSCRKKMSRSARASLADQACCTPKKHLLQNKSSTSSSCSLQDIFRQNDVDQNQTSTAPDDINFRSPDVSHKQRLRGTKPLLDQQLAAKALLVGEKNRALGENEKQLSTSVEDADKKKNYHNTNANHTTTSAGAGSSAALSAPGDYRMNKNTLLAKAGAASTSSSANRDCSRSRARPSTLQSERYRRMEWAPASGRKLEKQGVKNVHKSLFPKKKRKRRTLRTKRRLELASGPGRAETRSDAARGAGEGQESESGENAIIRNPGSTSLAARNPNRNNRRGLQQGDLFPREEDLLRGRTSSDDEEENDDESSDEQQSSDSSSVSSCSFRSIPRGGTSNLASNRVLRSSRSPCSSARVFPCSGNREEDRQQNKLSRCSSEEDLLEPVFNSGLRDVGASKQDDRRNASSGSLVFPNNRPQGGRQQATRTTSQLLQQNPRHPTRHSSCPRSSPGLDVQIGGVVNNKGGKINNYHRKKKREPKSDMKRKSTLAQLLVEGGSKAKLVGKRKLFASPDEAAKKLSRAFASDVESSSAASSAVNSPVPNFQVNPWLLDVSSSGGEEIVSPAANHLARRARSVGAHQHPVDASTTESQSSIANPGPPASSSSTATSSACSSSSSAWSSHAESSSAACSTSGAQNTNPLDLPFLDHVTANKSKSVSKDSSVSARSVFQNSCRALPTSTTEYNTPISRRTSLSPDRRPPAAPLRCRNMSLVSGAGSLAAKFRESVAAARASPLGRLQLLEEKSPEVVVGVSLSAANHDKAADVVKSNEVQHDKKSNLFPLSPSGSKSYPPSASASPSCNGGDGNYTSGDGATNGLGEQVVFRKTEPLEPMTGAVVSGGEVVKIAPQSVDRKEILDLVGREQNMTDSENNAFENLFNGGKKAVRRTSKNPGITNDEDAPKRRRLELEEE
ncbi:unnamed protein product [Amoebophrya sp. A120]|nr:unnamed protein product [Amoebophrya sp. A120]|eukprot:GSA120T00014337001.1